MSRITGVAAIQMKCGRDVLENIKTADRLVRDAVKKGADIILLPELFERQYFCQERRYEYYEYAKSVDEDAAVVHFTEVARELGVVIIVSFYEKDINQLYNTVAVIDADGTRLGIYRKTHIPDDHYYQEKFYFVPGNTGFKVFNTRFGCIGVGICWDQWFPEAARSMALLGAEIIPQRLRSFDLQLDGRIALIARMVAESRDAEQALTDGAAPERWVAHLESMAAETENVDYIVVADCTGKRVYHPNHALIGQYFVGGDEVDAEQGSEPYITTRHGTEVDQRRAFHTVYNEEDEPIGFVMVSASMERIQRQKQELMKRFLLVFAPALLAGLAVGVYASPEDTAAVWQRDLTFEPQMEEHHRAQLLHGWHKAVERSLAWAKE